MPALPSKTSPSIPRSVKSIDWFTMQCMCVVYLSSYLLGLTQQLTSGLTRFAQMQPSLMPASKHASNIETATKREVYELHKLAMGKEA